MCGKGQMKSGIEINNKQCKTNEWIHEYMKKTNKIYTEMNTSINKSMNKQTHTQFNQ